MRKKLVQPSKRGQPTVFLSAVCFAKRAYLSNEHDRLTSTFTFTSTMALVLAGLTRLRPLA
jgi:hypothetical protein